MRLNDLLNGEHIKVEHGAEAGVRDIAGLTCDSRQVEPGFLFAALPGTHADGRTFIAEAIRRGAAAVLAPPGAETESPDCRIPLIIDDNPRRRFALMAARFFPKQPSTIAAVTGTNGKTSVVSFVRQIWRHLGREAASIGTLGVVAPGLTVPGSLTTPDPAQLHKTLNKLAGNGVTHLALEASSHGLDQHRLDGVKIGVAAFTNLSRDHLDYHDSMAAYLKAKERLFADVMAPGGVAVINADSACFAALRKIAEKRRQRVIGYGRAGAEIRLEAIDPLPGGQRLKLVVDGNRYAVTLPLVGAFQAENALCALGVVIACGEDPKSAAAALEMLEGVPGRIQKVAAHPGGADIFVDFAHTPEALANVLTALRSHAEGRLAVVFGCGGDRDPGKRAEMGRIACKLADCVIVTDDNPRRENPAAIRRQILDACAGAREIGDRAEAIATALAGLTAGDLLVVAGKGHETGQIVGDRILPFDDAEVIRAALRAKTATAGPVLWTSRSAVEATRGRCDRDFAATGVSIDTRTLAPGDLFVALKGPNFDGHDYVVDAMAKGAAAAMVHRLPAGVSGDAPVLMTDDTMKALADLAAAARARAKARIIAVTGSVGKTGIKEALKLVLGAQAPTFANAGNLNNHWGLPLSLARMPEETVYGIFEMGMNHPGEITPLSMLAKPHVAVISTVEPVHSAFFSDVTEIADAKAEIFAGMEHGADAVLNRDNPHFQRLADAAKAGGAATVRSFGAHEQAWARLVDCSFEADGSRITAKIGDEIIVYRIGVVGRHWAINSLAVLAAVSAIGGNVAKAAMTLGGFVVPEGRGRAASVNIAGGAFTVIDESYNASPVSMNAALEVLGRTQPGPGGRRIAVLGDMLELGPMAGRLHEELAAPLQQNGVDLVFTAGANMSRLTDVLPRSMRGGHAADSRALAPIVTAATRPGDVVMVKGSAGSRTGLIVNALRELASGDGERREIHAVNGE